MSELLAMQRVMAHRNEARRLGITEEELHRKKYMLKVAWEDGGGIDGARARLKFAENFIARSRVANVRSQATAAALSRTVPIDGWVGRRRAASTDF